MSNSPFDTPAVKAKLGQSKERLTDTAPEVERIVISVIAWSGAAHKWTWALFRTTHIGGELYAEIPQEPTTGYELDQKVLADIFALYPEVKYLTGHPQQFSLWPSIECKFVRVPKAVGKGTRLQLVSFTQRDHYREDDISRDEQRQKLMERSGMNNEEHEHNIAISAQAEAEQAQWDELGKQHWHNDKKWWAELNEVKALYRDTAIMKSADWDVLIHQILKVDSLKDIDPAVVSGDAALDTIRAAVKQQFDQWWRNINSVALLKTYLINTGLPQVLNIAPSDVMQAACRAVGTGSIVEWGEAGHTGQEFIIAAKAAFEKQQDEQNKVNPQAEQAAVSAPPAIPIPETPNDSASTPASATAGQSLSDTKEDVKVEPQSNPTHQPLPEAPFSANFRMVHPSGVDVQFTIRAETVADGVSRVEKTIEALQAKGYTLPNARPVSAANGAVAHNSDGGIVSCVMIKIEASYEGGKPQLQFECDGMDRPLRFTKGQGEMVKLLSTIRKVDGTAFTAEDMTIGRKFAGNWKLEWKASEKDGKTYRNVVAMLA